MVDNYVIASVVYGSELPAADPEVPGVMPGASRFLEKVLERVHSTS
jgi:hypothetical protein